MLGLLAVALCTIGCTLTFNYNQCQEDGDCRVQFGDGQPFCTADNLCVKDPPPARLCARQVPEKTPSNAIALGAMMNVTDGAEEASDRLRIQALEMGVEELNEQAQFTRSLRPVVVTVCDTAQAKSKVDLENMVKYLVETRGAVGILGPMTTDAVTNVLTVVTSLQVPLVSPTAAGASISELADQGFIFRVVPVEDQQAVPVAKEIPSNTPQTPVVLTVASVQSDYGEGLRQTFQDEWNKKNSNNVPRLTSTYPDVLSEQATARVQQVAAGILAQSPAPDFLLLIASRRVHPHVLTMLRQLKDLRSFAQAETATQIWLSDGGKGNDLLTLATDPSMPLVLFAKMQGISPLSFDRDAKTGILAQSALDFRNGYQMRYKNTTDLENDLYIGYTYDAFYTLAAAAESVQGQATGPLTAAALRNIKSLKADKTFAFGSGSFASFNNATANLRVGAEVALRGVTGVLRFTLDGDRDEPSFDRWYVDVTETMDTQGKKVRTAKMVTKVFVSGGM
jgi:ABC-type branched-subunit amino acid transport system substrate-binding protein